MSPNKRTDTHKLPRTSPFIHPVIASNVAVRPGRKKCLPLLTLTATAQLTRNRKMMSIVFSNQKDMNVVLSNQKDWSVVLSNKKDVSVVLSTQKNISVVSSNQKHMSVVLYKQKTMSLVQSNYKDDKLELGWGQPQLC